MKHYKTIQTFAALGTCLGISLATPTLADHALSPAVAAAQLSNALIYQYDPNLAQMADYDQNYVKAAQNFTQTLPVLTQRNLTGSLITFRQTLYPQDQQTAKEAAYSPQGILKAVLSNNGADSIVPPASGVSVATLFSPDALANDLQQQSSVVNLDTNISNILSKQVLDSNDQSHALNFSNLIAKTYTPILDPSSIDLDKLGAYLANESSDKQAKTIASIQKDPNYQQLEAGIRSIVAQRSVPLDIFNYLRAERTAISNAPSALQQEYAMTHSRLNSAAWHQQMMTASPAVLQRETLYTMVQIEAMLYQLHMDNERIMAASALQAANGMTLSQTELLEQAKDVKSSIDKIIGVKSKASSLTDE